MPEPILTPEDRRIFDLVCSLVEDETAGQRIMVAVGPYSAWTMIGFLQMCMRNPTVIENPGMMSSARELCEMFALIFRKGPLWDVIQAGYDPANDVDQDGKPIAGFTCPHCGRTSYNPNDAAHQYCGHCREFHRGQAAPDKADYAEDDRA